MTWIVRHAAETANWNAPNATMIARKEQTKNRAADVTVRLC